MHSTEPDDRIRVALSRDRPTPRRVRPAIDAASATAAGLTFIAIVAVMALLGTWIGGQLGAPAFGGMIGGLTGAITGFIGLYQRYSDL